MTKIRESDLPGIGHKVEVTARNGDKLVIIIHDDGRRELYHFSYEDPEESISMITLDDEEARQVAGIIGGMTYKPKALETVEVALDDLTIEWYRMEPKSESAGKSIGELQIRQKTGASIIAMIDAAHRKIINPGPDHVLEAGTTLVVAGERHQVKALKSLLMK